MRSRFVAWRPDLGIAVALLAAAIIVVEMVMILTTRVLTYSSTQFVNDLWFTIDSMWRATSGQLPNVDFHSPIGPVFYGVYALTAQLMPFSAVMMLRADLLVGIVATVLTVAILWRKVPTEAVALMALLAFGAAVTGHEMGTSQFDRYYSFLAPYNRWSWALVIPAAAGALIPMRRTALAASLIGMIGVLLLFLKLSYFIVFIGFCVAGFGLDWVEGRGRLVTATLILVTVLLALIVLIAAPTMVHGYFADIANAASINALRVNKIALSAPEAAIFFAAGLLVLHLAGGLQGWRDWTSVARVAVAVGGGVLILLQNHDRSEAPMYAVALVIAYAVGRQHWAPGSAAVSQKPQLLSFCLVAIMAAPTLMASLSSAPFQYVAIRSGELHAFKEFQGTPVANLRLKDLTLADNRQANLMLIEAPELKALNCALIACTAMGRTAEGVTALRQLGVPPGSRILALDFSNPFPAIFGTPDPRFNYSWYDYGRSWTEAFGPEPAKLFSEADIVMEPLFNGPYDQLRRVYGGSLPRFYRLAKTTPSWRIWIKPTMTAGRS